jgi:hypothetical protein
VRGIVQRPFGERAPCRRSLLPCETDTELASKIAVQPASQNFPMESNGLVRWGRMCPVRVVSGRWLWRSLAVCVDAAVVPLAMVTRTG